MVLTSFRARDWDYLGWRYSVLVVHRVGGWNNVLNLLPARDSAENAHFAERDRAWLRGWLQWTATNKELLRHTRTILGQPALGKVDGTSADRWATTGSSSCSTPMRSACRHACRWMPRSACRPVCATPCERCTRWKDARLGKPGEGFWRRGDTTTLMLDGGTAMVLEVAPAPATVAAPVLFGATGTASISNGVLSVAGARGEAGTSSRLTVALPAGVAPSRATVNGVDAPMASPRAGVVELTARFAGAEFRPMQPVIAWDSTFTGGRVTGTFTIPARVFEQLRARQRAWPIPWTSDDFRTTWLAPERLLLHAPFSEPDDTWEASAAH